ncbi:MULTISPECIES: terminase small subunit [unclassified Caballeronia]|uniref:terminase small subunit n=1 Tax=unclassified Caballeronia TaxID=2646786 RepID=UPI001F353088|nr:MULTISPECIES: terminase small subunit [unclassified Caballeronia]MCE4544605.1 terminase small subunit [Caballeronia sp. PC1]MCE4571757.1 terminase small subunit [Caballeronia sp. CLC5]
MSRPLNPRESRFVDEYLVDLKQTAAAIRAGYSKATARTTACHLLSRPIVVEAINERMKERAARVRIDQDEVLRDLVAVFRADAASLSEYRRTCCRYCYGEDNRYQRTKGEMERDREAYAKLVREAQKKDLEPLAPFDEKGGTGWDPRRDPSPKCQECFGEGLGNVFLKDTRTLVGGDTRLFDGVEETKEGVKVRVRDRNKVAEMLGRHLGMFNDKLQITKPKARIKDFTGRKKQNDGGDDE